MTKKVIDLEGNEIYVPKETVVRTDNGVHYLHTPEEQATYNAKNIAEVAKQKDYIDNHKYKDDRKEIEPKYKTVEEQFDMQYWDKKNGTNTWEEHIDIVKASHPKT